MPTGPLMIIGGAEDKLNRRSILGEFVGAAGGSDARVAVLPTASSIGDEVTGVYDAVFRSLGARDVVPVRPESRDDAHDPALVEMIDGCSGIFMTGGNQLKLSGIVSGTPLGDAIVAAHHRGAVVAGTSAGASIQSSHMVAFGRPGSTPKQRMTQVAAGLGLLEQTVIDQHFDQRNRYGRLLMIVAQSPQLLGIGVDEDTAAVVEHQDGRRLLRVLGRGSVTVLDPARMVSNAHEASRSTPLLASGVVLHVLPAGSIFDIDGRALVPAAPGELDTDFVAEIAQAQQDLRRVARDIAAADASPSAWRRRQGRQARSRTLPPDTDPQDGTP